jgi:hypothetical protein
MKNFTCWIARYPAILSTLLALTAVSGFVTPAQAVGRSALGIMVGEPSGLSGKLWLDASHAVDAGLAYSLNDFLLLQGSYLVHFGALSEQLKASEPALRQIRPYIGIGGILFFSMLDSGSERSGFRQNGDDTGLALRIPLGLEWMSSKLGVFAELAPGIGILPSTFTVMGGSVGVRYYFQ